MLVTICLILLPSFFIWVSLHLRIKRCSDILEEILVLVNKTEGSLPHDDLRLQSIRRSVREALDELT